MKSLRFKSDNMELFNDSVFKSEVKNDTIDYPISKSHLFID